MLTAVSLLIYGGYIMSTENFSQETASLGISMGFMYAVLPISGVIICLYGLLNLLDIFKVLSSPDVDRYGVSAES